MKYIGIDYGTKKVGIAVSDDEGSFAFPKEIVSTPEALEYLMDIIKNEEISGVVIGQSLSNNGQENDLLTITQAFAKRLGAKVSTPIFWEREGFSSVEAHRYQTKAGDRDDSAAAIILQRFLDKNTSKMIQ